MDESRVTRYATEKYVDKINIKDSEIDEVFDELSMKPRKRYKITYDYDKTVCRLHPTPSHMYGDEEVRIALLIPSAGQYYMKSICVMEGDNDITNNVFDNGNKFINLKSINNDIDIKIVIGENIPA